MLMKANKIGFDNLFEIAELTQFFRIEYLLGWIQLIKLKEENRFLAALYVRQYISSDKKK